MATRKFRKTRKSNRSGKRYRPTATAKRTARRRRTSTAGKILPPLDVRSSKHLKEFEKRIKNGDLTIILVWAQWCPHCHTMMPHFDAAAKSPNRSIQAVKVEEQMLPAVNQVLTTNINKSAKPLNVEGYPSIIVVDKQGNKVTDLEPVRNTATMKQVMDSAGPLAAEAGINTPSASPSKVATGLNNTLKSINNGTKVNNTNNKNKKLLSNLGVEEEGLATTRQNMNESPRNIDVGEDEVLGSIASKNVPNKNIKLASASLTNKPNNKPKSLESLKNAMAPSPLNTFNEAASESNKPLTSDMKKLSQEAEEVTSLAAPLTPPNMARDVDDIENSEDVESISNSLTPEQKVSGGGSKGGSLYSAMARTTYSLAPAAALLATAAMVIKRGRKTHKKSKKSRKSRKQRKQRR